MTQRTDHYRFRSELVDRLRGDLLGPVGGDEEILKDAPLDAYTTGILFPRLTDTEVDEERDAQVDEGQAPAILTVDELPDTGVSLANTQTPSSMGLTVAVDTRTANTLRIHASAAVYDPIDEYGNPTPAKRAARRTTDDVKLQWRRRVVGADPVDVSVTDPGERREYLADGLQLRVTVRRPHPETGAAAVTITLVNTHSVEAFDLRDPVSFFQPEILVSGVDDGRILVERPVPVGADDGEVRTNGLLYRHAPTFAVGHGCAVDWDWVPPPPRAEELLKGEPARVRTAWTTFVPEREMLLTDSNPDIDDSDLGMLYLAEATDQDVLAALRRLAAGYRAWISERAEEALLLADTPHAEAAKLQVDQCEEACNRIVAGIETLRDDPLSMAAFRSANRAMALQRGHTVWIKSSRAGEVKAGGVWRPFQIAFMLLCLNGIVDEQHPDRRTADLLWFPTGGGKTEAYLGLIAFTVFRRRMRRGDDGYGVTALMRYTLRLLTLQQFERAATLICAMETMRRERPDSFGHETISIGMWVGRAATPNKVHDAQIGIKKLRDGGELQTENAVQLRGCPWCGTPMDAWHYEADASTGHMHIHCPNEQCDFHHGLPVHVVDEVIYRVRPTLLIATVDKFAQIAWRAEVASLFNRDLPKTPPPELIVQDELHLISGALGTLTGLYETAIDAAADEPKVIASTATIRRARDQGRRLFDREVRQFPPAGLDARDSWFAVETPAESKSSRLYVGLLSPGTSQASLLVRAYAALLHHASRIEADESVRDAYWTLIGYFNSLRLLAAAELQVLDDVQDRLKLLAGEGQPAREVEGLAELTSRVKSSDIPKRLKDLEIGRPSDDVFDTVLATNMISVGVDVDRLGLMAIMGQPQTTAEYIQASSRVGRRDPGLVVMLYNASRSRDRSHYERFVSYHSALYRQVESTSVTPFSSRARDRALHAVFVGLGRLVFPEMRPNSAAGNARRFGERFEELKDIILARVRAVDPEEAAGTEADLDDIIAKWRKMADNNPDLVYEAKANFKRSEPRADDTALLCTYADEDLRDAIPTLWSMRDVDVESDLYQER
ncbi:helicase-related protein [Herbidospora yilanensis]|uniref:helicase-related protein n=1 Tax=Herbidospora yilanensis TaxID=354426 RepID=UPI000782E920|nr:helicase-related protein [Herbidospora yilanensis]